MKIILTLQIGNSLRDPLGSLERTLGPVRQLWFAQSHLTGSHAEELRDLAVPTLVCFCSCDGGNEPPLLGFKAEGPLMVLTLMSYKVDCVKSLTYKNGRVCSSCCRA